MAIAASALWRHGLRGHEQLCRLAKKNLPCKHAHFQLGLEMLISHALAVAERAHGNYSQIQFLYFFFFEHFIWGGDGANDDDACVSFSQRSQGQNIPCVHPPFDLATSRLCAHLFVDVSHRET